MEENGNYRYVPEQNSGKPKNWKKLGKTLLIAAVVLVVAVASLSCFTQSTISSRRW